MKKTLLTFAIAIACNFSYAQTNTFPATGNVGIGTTTPRGKLDVDFGSSGGFSFISNRGDNEWGVQLWDETKAVGGLSANGGTGEIRLGGFSASYFPIIYSNGSEALRITTSGDVAIGTTDPKGYKLAVGGNMIAESVKIKLQGTWPDYVFAKDYKLLSLKEIESYIKKNGYLPGIPSAEDIKANGIELGEINAKLLQKIEELTLHLIEMKKEIQLLQDEAALQKQAIEN